jgi:hypothetical protein
VSDSDPSVEVYSETDVKLAAELERELERELRLDCEPEPEPDSDNSRSLATCVKLLVAEGSAMSESVV